MSSKHPEPLDLERDLPTSPADIAALRRIRESRRIPFAEYLQWLSRYEAPPGTRRRLKRLQRHEPFEL